MRIFICIYSDVLTYTSTQIYIYVYVYIYIYILEYSYTIHIHIHIQIYTHKTLGAARSFSKATKEQCRQRCL